jgi:hypothetical protein
MRNLSASGALLGLSVLAWGCGDTFISLSSDGRLEISITTSGDAPDLGGLTIIVDGGPPALVGADGVVTLTELSPGPHQVQLAGVGEGCRVDGANPRTVAVGGDGQAMVRFAVVCHGAGGRRS